jgi:hypothetical protein
MFREPASSVTVMFWHRATGGSLSTTVTICWQAAVKPALSVTVQVTDSAENPAASTATMW